MDKLRRMNGDQPNTILQQFQLIDYIASVSTSSYNDVLDLKEKKM